MTNNPKFTVQLLEKIGSPLTVAINHVLPEGEDTEVQAAQIMAQLLGQTTQVSTSLYNTLEIKEAEEQADSTRLALAALVAPLIAEAYQYRKQLPAEDDIGRIGKSLEALISFCENFSPATDQQSRLQTIDHDAVLFDKDQPGLVVLQAMVPVINAVEEFPFGQSKTKLVQDIATKLEQTAAEMAQKIGDADKLKELLVFKALAALYTSCHVAETERASTESDAALSLDPVWESFATKIAMVEALMGYEDSAADGAGDGAPEPAQETSQASAPVAEEKPKDEPAAPPPAAAGGPMGFFAKKPEGEDTPPVEEAPPAEKTETAQTTETSAETPPPAAEEEKTDGSSDEAPSSPMGFFKPGAQKKEEGDS